jgi:predicted house-cleaning noncanonical NTP pyrophosphatase (MazG superfamily)
MNGPMQTQPRKRVEIFVEAPLLRRVLAALDEEMAEWLFDLVAEASCTLLYVISGLAAFYSYESLKALGGRRVSANRRRRRRRH